ncbi:MAG: ribonuclease H-like domain-containing protein [Spirochaeta sp.]|jgi:hypothetical protein|nr:ribonuclease H-like domain-containing protein [Spirochaeta sp.]
MSDLYNRLKRIRAQRGETRRPGDTGFTGRAAPAGNADLNDRAAPPAGGAIPGAPGADWGPIAPGVYERRTVQPIATGRYGNRFSATGRWDTLSPLTRRPAGMTPVFLDIETTGLSGGAGSVAFLIGIGTPVGADETTAIDVRQIMLLDPGNEAAQLDRFLALVAEIPDPQYVTYNGASFDLPVLRSRFTMQRRRFPEACHFDLLHLVRRLYARRIGSCSLGAVEARVLGHPRTDDVSGSEAPARYLEYVRSGDPRGIEPVLLHHLRDIVNLSEVALAVNGVLLGTADAGAGPAVCAAGGVAAGAAKGADQAPPLPPSSPDRQGPLPPDSASLARLLMERGLPEHADRARALLETEYDATAARIERVRAFARSRGMRGRSGLRGRYPAMWIESRELLAELARKGGDREQYRHYAEELYRELGRYADLVRLVKLLEHDTREFDRAIAVLEQWGAGRGWDPANGWDAALTHRLTRLRRRSANARTSTGATELSAPGRPGTTPRSASQTDGR